MASFTLPPEVFHIHLPAPHPETLFPTLWHVLCLIKVLRSSKLFSARQKYLKDGKVEYVLVRVPGGQGAVSPRKPMTLISRVV